MRTIIHAALLAVPAAALLAACGGSDDAATPIAPTNQRCLCREVETES